LINISQSIKNEMDNMGLLYVTVVKDGNGKSIWYKDENGNFKKSIRRNYWVINKNKTSDGKGYVVEDRTYYKYLEIKQK